MNNLEIAKFKHFDKEIKTKLDKKNKTAWFTSDALQALFRRDKSSISSQITAVLKSVNQKGPTVAKVATVQIKNKNKLNQFPKIICIHRNIYF